MIGLNNHNVKRLRRSDSCMTIDIDGCGPACIELPVDMTDMDFYRNFSGGYIQVAWNAKKEYIAVFHKDRPVYPVREEIK